MSASTVRRPASLYACRDDKYIDAATDCMTLTAGKKTNTAIFTIPAMHYDMYGNGYDYRLTGKYYVELTYVCG